MEKRDEGNNAVATLPDQAVNHRAAREIRQTG